MHMFKYFDPISDVRQVRIFFNVLEKRLFFRGDVIFQVDAA